MEQTPPLPLFPPLPIPYSPLPTFFWLNYALLQLCHAQPELRSLHDLDQQLVALSAQDHPTHASIVSWLVERTQSPQAGPQAIDELRAVDRWLQANNMRVWLLYDELDAGFGSGQQWYVRDNGR